MMALRFCSTRAATLPATRRMLLPTLTAMRMVRFHTGQSPQQEVTSASNTSSSVSTHPPQNVDKLHGSYHWDLERAMAVAMPALVAATAIGGSHPVTDALIGVVLPTHIFIGLDACLVDYVHQRNFPKSARVAKGALWLTYATVLYGCYHINTEDVGLTELLMRVWAA